MNTLIIGGTSGLGLELARRMAAEDEVFVTGRHDPEVDFAEYLEFDLSKSQLPNRIGQFVMGLPRIDSLMYAAGYFQDGRITDLSDEQVDEMVNVSGRGLIFFVKKILEKQGGLPELVSITSTSQFVPREYEPVYNFAKAGAGHFSNGIALDPRIGQVLVAGPSAMATDFWEGTNRDTSSMLPANWVADQIMLQRQEDYTYRSVKILGKFGDLPDRVEVVETRA